VRPLRAAEKGKKHVVDEQGEEILCIRQVSFGRINAHKKDLTPWQKCRALLQIRYKGPTRIGPPLQTSVLICRSPTGIDLFYSGWRTSGGGDFPSLVFENMRLN